MNRITFYTYLYYLLLMEDKLDLKHCAERWGLCSDTINDLGQRLFGFWERYCKCLTNRYHDTSEHALTYLKGLLLLPNKRNYKQIARAIEGPESDGQNLQNYMSDSPWLGEAVFDQIQAEIVADPRLHGGSLSLDERGELCFGLQKAGAARQYIGNAGKVDVGQVGVCLGYYTACLEDPQTIGLWTLVDAELFFPEAWFDEDHKKQFKRLHIPPDRKFQTKLEIGLALIDRAKANQLPFTRLSCDGLYGRSHDYRAKIDQRGILYLADIPSDLKLYLEEPVTGVPVKSKNTKGRKPSRWQVLNNVEPIEARQIAARPDTTFTAVDIRACERGRLIYDCAERQIWTITSNGTVRSERLLIRKESDGSMSYSLSNADNRTTMGVLAQWRSERYFVERVFEDGNGEAGWDELEAQKYRAWMHHAALTALALWFVTQTKLEWAYNCPKDETLATEIGVDKLPQLSMANVRILLQAVIPIRQLTVEQAIDLVTRLLVGRAASTASRLKKQQNYKQMAPD